MDEKNPDSNSPLAKLSRDIDLLNAALAPARARWSQRFDFDEIAYDSYYSCHPLVFREAFPEANEERVHLLTLACHHLARAACYADDVMDEAQGPHSPTRFLMNLHAHHFECYQHFFKLFEVGHRFWEKFHTCYAAYTEACLTEADFVLGKRSWSDFDEVTGRRVIVDYLGMSHIGIWGLAALTDREATAEAVVASERAYHLARQLWDDLCDWKLDLQRGFPTILLKRVLPEQPTWQDKRELQRLVHRLAGKIYYQGYAETAMLEILAYLDQAETALGALTVPVWRGLIQKLRGECTRLRRDMNQLIQTNVDRSKETKAFDFVLAPPRNPLDHMIQAAATFVVGQWQKGLGEVRHIMLLADDGDASRGESYRHGDVFQRALIADALQDADRILDGGLKPVIDEEVVYLLSQRQTEGMGGWKYVPDMAELPPDTANLAQMILVLVGAGRRDEVDRLCRPLIEVLLRDNTREDGGIETWIVPAGADLSKQADRRWLDAFKGGAGPDVEIVANMAYALLHYDPEHYEEPIRKAAHFLEGRIEEAGCWRSPWCFGPFFPTYLALRLLTRVQPQSPAILEARDFLLARQQEDGSWGQGGKNDPLATAHALLALRELEDDVAPELLHTRVRNGLRALSRTRRSQSGWPAVHFIKSRFQHPYSSQTVTTAFALKAASVWQAYSMDHDQVVSGKWRAAKGEHR
ncbi:SQHop-cyclase-C domain-containing protein [Sulfidibacter corallicola]|uniref:Squalene cyclase C-terminal domain-containing protein n=1 Tax=Sulfidibacter corallicola TaxID=2818388 RepID=A0A8A4TQH6_SULCO|nr:hypothetical protein [Sulfidibacter corallicola]QTD51810.1 hypothetical protein J3U87_05010 [Sulfidibacter corallicola]